MKTCNKCKLDKEISEFGKHKRTKSGLRSTCKECERSLCKIYKDNNRQKVRLSSREYKRKNSDKIYAYRQRYYLDNKEREIKNCTNWRINNLDRFNAGRSRRYASQLLCTPHWLTKQHLVEILAFYAKARELTKTTGIKHEVDHTIPLQGESVTGLHVPWNLQILTKSENSSKKNKIDWNKND